VLVDRREANCRECLGRARIGTSPLLHYAKIEVEMLTESGRSVCLNETMSLVDEGFVDLRPGILNDLFCVVL
jgi:hypothetical protein